MLAALSSPGCGREFNIRFADAAACAKLDAKLKNWPACCPPWTIAMNTTKKGVGSYSLEARSWPPYL
jgi:hypothetical protein